MAVATLAEAVLTAAAASKASPLVHRSYSLANPIATHLYHANGEALVCSFSNDNASVRKIMYDFNMFDDYTLYSKLWNILETSNMSKHVL